MKPQKASDIQAEAIDWLWAERIPRGMITTIAGRPDVGKGLFGTYLAAQVSQAGGKVLFSAAEDSHSLMTKPRLVAAGANLDNVLIGRFMLPLHWNELQEIVIDEQIDLIIMDPWAAHLSGGISRFSDNVRTLLTPLTTLIESTRTSVVIMEHALKRVAKNGHPLDCIGGSSSGLPAASRAAYVIGRDPDDADKRVLAPAKFNIGPWPDAVSFELDVEELDTGEVPYLAFDEEIEHFDAMRLFTAPPLSAAKAATVGRPADKRSAAAEWLTVYLADTGAPVPAGTVEEDAKQWGMSSKTLKRAAADMGVVKHPPGGGPKCTWDLPDDVKAAMGLLPDPADTPPPAETPDLVGDFDQGLADLLGGDDA